MKQIDSDQPQAPETRKGLLASLLLRAERAEGGLAQIAGQTAKKYRADLSDTLAPPDSDSTPVTSYVSYGDREAYGLTDEAPEEEDA